MKRFRFSLQTLLRYRTLLEERRREELSQCLARESQALQHLTELKTRLDTLTSPPLSGSDDLSWWALAAQYREQVRLLAEKADEVYRKTVLESGRARSAWQEARVQMRLVERLREKALRAWQEEADREAQSLADDLFLARWPLREEP